MMVTINEYEKNILELSNEDARNFFLHSSKFCTIDLPKYFDFQPLLDNLVKEIGNHKLCEVFEEKPNDYENVNYKFLTNKDGNFAWRPFQIINPAIYICLVNRITETCNWKIIKKRFESFQENERIKCFSLPIQTEDSDTQLKTDIAANILNWWEEMEQRSIELALHYNCVLVTDISECYSSIYTHSIGWALHGKKEAREHRKVVPPTLIGCIIDDMVQAMSYRQTNGIPQGSVLMDFVAEIVLGYADLMLSQKIRDLKISSNNDEIDYQILRYRDDYRIFTHTQEDAVKLAKLLSEVLSDLNLKLNVQKTFVSNNIIRDVIKPDKLYWIEAKHQESTLQKHLLIIHSLAAKYPNSGSLSAALASFLERIYPLSLLKENSSKVLISILIDIAYNNPRIYSQVIVIIGKLLSIEPDSSKVSEIYDLINKKFESKPNIGYWKVWLQRLTIKDHREKEKNSQEMLCQIAANRTDAQLWNICWLKENVRCVFQKTSIFSQEKFDEIPNVPDKEEAQLFDY